MYRVCSFAGGQLIVDAQAQAYTCEHLLPHSVRFTRPTVRVWITVCRSTLSQHNRRKDGFHFNKRNCFSLELKAEIINAVDIKRKTKAQIYRTSPYRTSWKTPRRRKTASTHKSTETTSTTLKCSPGKLYTFLKDKEAMKHNPKAHDTL